MRPRLEAVSELEALLESEFAELADVQRRIKEKLIRLSDGKVLKGDELVGWLGEILGKELFGGRLVDDRCEHDVETPSGARISVKTRRGLEKGWQQTSAIPKIDGKDNPSHLLFVHLQDDYSVRRIWLFPWGELREAERFKVKRVRGAERAYSFRVRDVEDRKYQVYPPGAPA